MSLHHHGIAGRSAESTVPALRTASPGGGTDLVVADNLSGNALQRLDPHDPISQAADLL